MSGGASGVLVRKTKTIRTKTYWDVGEERPWSQGNVPLAREGGQTGGGLPNIPTLENTPAGGVF